MTGSLYGSGNYLDMLVGANVTQLMLLVCTFLRTILGPVKHPAQTGCVRVMLGALLGLASCSHSFFFDALQEGVGQSLRVLLVLSCFLLSSAVSVYGVSQSGT